ncbi:MAG TPA: hypothetical protein PK323_03945 [Bacteroidia bacterium]|nr:hypothetical protein [Bacteroidia bacterium]
MNSKLEIKLVEPPKYPITQNQSLIENRSNEKQYMASMDKHAFSQKSELNSIKKLQNKNNIILKNKAISKLDFKKLNKFQMVPLYHPKVKDDTYTILLVILSLFPFIALIAMYLKDNKSITMNFWVDLLLHLTVIGYAIFAVLVVLDIISLA